MPMQPLPAQRSRIRAGGSVIQGWKPRWIISPIGERGISTRSSTVKGKPQNSISPSR